MADNRVLVTGADGFIGSHLVEMLVENGCSVKALVQYNSYNHWGWLEQVACLDAIEVVCGDVRDAQYCRAISKDVDIIFHLAALIAIPYSYKAAASYVDTNVNGTLNICQAAVENGVKRVIHTSTSEVYGSAICVPMAEDHPLQPQSPYSASKIGADAIAKSFYYSFDLPVTIARPFNTYGPRQSARAVIPSVITQIINGQCELRLGNTTPTRDFNFVLDICRGLLALARCDEAVGETVNIGSGLEVSVTDTVSLIKDIMGSDISVVRDEDRFRPTASEVQRLCSDTSKLKRLTGFETRYTFKAGLEKTIEWFRCVENTRLYKAHLYNL